jgi:phosphoglucosamine mutase
MPTPAVAHLTKSMGAAAGIMLTASHNPFDDNGIKIFGGDGFKLSDAMESRIEGHVLSPQISSEHIRSDKLGKAFRIEDARGRYIEFAKWTIQSLDLSGLKVVLDCANGASYFIAPLIFKELGADVVKIYAEPDGFNINNGCGALHPETIGKAVIKHKADLGIAFDGDADRVIFCDRNGNVVDGDRILAMCALHFKETKQLNQDTLVVTSMSNLGLHEAMARNGIKVEVTDVGDRQVIERMRSHGYNLGGEKCGHLIFLDYNTTGDGIISALRVLQLLKHKHMSLQDLALCMTEYPQKLVNIPVREKRPLATLPHVQEQLQACHAALGQTGRVLLRYSGTESKLRLMLEAKDDAVIALWLDRISAAIREDLG